MLPPSRVILLKKADILELYKALAQKNPAPQTELVHHNHFELLVSVILSAQATDISVNKATKPLFKIANDPESIFNLGVDGLIPFIKTIGLYNAKANNIIKTCKILMEEYDGIVPSTRESLEKLPGVGRKTANVVLNEAFGIPTIAVDTHVYRVSRRTGLADFKSLIAVEEKLLKVTPKQYLKYAHHFLILHGRYICKARAPLCEMCPITSICKFYKKSTNVIKTKNA